MESTCLCSSSFLKLHPFSHKPKTRKIRFPMKISASFRRDTGGHNYQGGHLVDENMIVLRKRIHEMKMVERNYEPPSNWMEWEKRYYTCYDSMTCEIMGVLQTQLMNTRPSMALGMAVLVMMSVPTSTAILALHLVEMAKGVLAGIH